MFFCVFLVRKRRRKIGRCRCSGRDGGGKWPKKALDGEGGDCDKNLYFFFVVVKWGGQIIAVTISYFFWTVTMTDSTIGKGFIYLVTAAQTLRYTPMVQRTPRPCPSRVNDVAVKWSRYVRVACLCSGEGNGEVLQRDSHIAMCTNILKH